MAVVWDFVKKTSDTGAPVITTEYYDTTAQHIFIKNGRIVSTYGRVDRGNWLGAVFGEDADIGGAENMRAIHEYNGELWACADNRIMRYRYMRDISDMIISADTCDTSDSIVRDISITLQSGEHEINDTTSLYSQGSKITVDLSMGDSSKERVITAYCDEIAWQTPLFQCRISARCAIGYFLSDATFDESTQFTGTRKGIIYQMLEYSGIPLYMLEIENDLTEVSYTFDMTDKKLDIIKKLCEEWNWIIHELPDGRIIIGSRAHIDLYAPERAHIYNKNEGLEYSIILKTDNAFTRLAVVSYQDSGSVNTAYVTLSSYQDRDLPRKTKYITVQKNLSMSDVASLAAQYKSAYDNLGTTAEFKCPIRPSLMCGDVAVFADADGYSLLERGIVTSVRHMYGRDGVYSVFTLDGSGKMDISADGTVTTYSVSDVEGDTRRRQLIDEVQKETDSMSNSEIAKIMGV